MDRKKTAKKPFSAELAYILGIAAIAFATALMERADFGMSMVVAPAYILHVWISRYAPWYTFGMSEYILQGALLLALVCVMGRFKKGYLFSFVTAVIYGFMLDGFVALAALLPLGGWAGRTIYYLSGMAVCALGVALVFHTYIAPEVYELFVKEISQKTGRDTSLVKTLYDCISCAIGVALSFILFGWGRFVGVKWGTVVCALVNGWLIGVCAKWLDKRFEFHDSLPMRKHFS